MESTYVPNRTISLPDDVVPFIGGLGVPFSTWVADRLRHHAATQSEVDVWQTHVVPITSNVDSAGIAGNVFLPMAATGLTKDSVAVPLGLELIDRALLAERAGRLPRILIDDLDDGLQAVLGI